MSELNKFVGCIRGLLNPEGYIALSLPNRCRSLDYFDEGDYPPNHLTRWNINCLKKYFENAGFTTIEARAKQFDLDELRSYINARIRFGIINRVVSRQVTRTNALPPIASKMAKLKYILLTIILAPFALILRMLPLQGSTLYYLGKLK
jgi:hypothetical protein